MWTGGWSTVSRRGISILFEGWSKSKCKRKHALLPGDSRGGGCGVLCVLGVLGTEDIPWHSMM